MLMARDGQTYRRLVKAIISKKNHFLQRVFRFDCNVDSVEPEKDIFRMKNNSKTKQNVSYIQKFFFSFFTAYEKKTPKFS